jgi:hypothetical protein
MPRTRPALGLMGAALLAAVSLGLPPARPGPGPRTTAARSRDAAEKDAGKRRAEKAKPKLSLTSDPAVGFTPVTTVVTGHLTGVDPRDPNFCHAAVTWIRIDPGQTEDDGIRVREDPACLHGPEEASVETSFTRTFYLTRPGSYLVRLIVEGRDGTRITSGFTKVQVLRVQ